LSIEAAAATPQMDFFNSLLVLEKMQRESATLTLFFITLRKVQFSSVFNFPLRAFQKSFL